MIIQDGAGQQFGLEVDSKNRGQVKGVQSTLAQRAVEAGEAWVFGGTVTLVDATQQGILYVKNGLSDAFHVERVIVSYGVSTGGTTAESTLIEVFRNTTTGTLVSEATAATIKANRKFSSPAVLSSSVLVYQGDATATVTDGSRINIFNFQPALSAGSLVVPVDYILGENDSLAITATANVTNSSLIVYVLVEGFFNTGL